MKKKIYEHHETAFDSDGCVKVYIAYTLFVKRTGPRTALFQEIRRAENWESLRECVDRKHYTTMGEPFQMVRVDCRGGGLWVSPAEAADTERDYAPDDYLYEYPAGA